jgi:hypothetical protein
MLLLQGSRPLAVLTCRQDEGLGKRQATIYLIHKGLRKGVLAIWCEHEINRAALLAKIFRAAR